MLTGALASPFARGEVYHEPHLASDEAVLLHGVHFSMLRQLSFWRVDKPGNFAISGSAPRVVKAGWYFLRSYTTAYVDLKTDVFPTPQRLEDAIEVISGAVTYIGDVIGTINKDKHPPVSVKIEVRRETLVKAHETCPWVEKYPLFVSLQGREPRPMSWMDFR